MHLLEYSVSHTHSGKLPLKQTSISSCTNKNYSPSCLEQIGKEATTSIHHYTMSCKVTVDRVQLQGTVNNG